MSSSVIENTWHVHYFIVHECIKIKRKALFDLNKQTLLDILTFIGRYNLSIIILVKINEMEIINVASILFIQRNRKKPGWCFVVFKTYLIMQYMHCHYNLHRVLHYKDCFTFPGIMDFILSSAYACHYLNHGSIQTQAWKPNMEVIFLWHLNCNTSASNRSKKTLFITDCRWCRTVYYIAVNLIALFMF